MKRTSIRLASLGVVFLAGYAAGSWNGGIIHAAKDPAKELIEADHAFDAATTRDGLDGWLSFFAPDGIMMPAGQDIIVGQPAIRGFLTKAFSAPGFALRWEPVDAAASGDLGYTYGISKVTRTGANGAPSISYGKYVTIWRKQRDRSWKIALDIGNASPAPEAKTP
jgi:ketosteroid isomerase-like protein